MISLDIENVVAIHESQLRELLDQPVGESSLFHLLRRTSVSRDVMILRLSLYSRLVLGWRSRL